MDNNENNINQQPEQIEKTVENPTSEPVAQPQPVQQPKSNKTLKIVLIVIGALFGGLILFIVAIFLIITLFVNSSSKLVCTSKEGNITISYNDKTITGYTANGITYDFDGQKLIADRIGSEEYIKQFDVWFRTHTSGTCINEKK